MRSVPLHRWALGVALFVAFAFTGFNIFKYPNYELDEGTYLGSAWSIFNEGKLSYYTYTYAIRCSGGSRSGRGPSSWGASSPSARP